MFVFSVCSAFAQGTRSGRKPAPTEFARFESIEGFTDGDGAYLRWVMTVETGNVGFLVYRVGQGGLELVSDGLIQGSVAKTGLRPLNGGNYYYFDPQGRLDTAYVIVSRATDGRRVSTASFTPRFTNDFFGDTGYTKEFLVEHSRYQGGKLDNRSPALTRELTAEVNASRPAPNPDVQRWTVAQPGVKIAVKQDGMYRVSRAELQTAGFPVDSDSTNWRLFLNGNEQSIIVGDGNQYVDFYGRGIDTFETDTRIYYLINDTVPGRRMVSKILGSIGGNVVSNNYRSNSYYKERVSYASSIQNGDVENYFGHPVISDPPLTETITLTGVDPQGPDALLQLNIQGLLNTVHHIHVVINGVDAGVLPGSGVTHFGGTFVIPQNLLIEGTNSIVLNTVESNDACYFDSINVNYSRRYVADQNRIPFYTPGYRRANVTGFTSPNIRVFDTTLDGDPQLIVNPQIVQDGGTYTVRMPSNRPAVFFAVEDSGLLQSPSVTFDNPSTLASPDNLADMIIISYSSPEFLASAENWANYRRSSNGGGFNVKVVNIDDVFDEFSYGLHQGNAIKDFLAYAQSNWQSPKPSYVLILGDASYDRRNYEGFGYWDLVPTKNVSLIYEETGSDDALTDFTTPVDGLADVPIGRIPARNSVSIDIALAKTMEFETPANQSLDRGALFAFDMPLGYDFDAMSHILANQLPPTVPVMFVPRGLPEPNPNHIQDPMAHQNLINAINAGKYIVNYAGHGSTGTWASSSFFEVSDVPTLTNTHSETIFTMLTCFNGFFLRPRPTDDSLGEALVKAGNGGAVATWASTTETTPDYQLTMGIVFYQDLGVGTITRLGDLIKAAKVNIAGSDVGYSWALLGDPALKIH